MDSPLIYAVDDEESITRLYEESIAMGGFEVKTAFDGAGLWRLIDEKLPNLIILDVMLEKEDGFAILKKIRENDGLKEIPVIMVSAKGSEMDKVNGLNLGADDYLSKPFGILELLARIKANLRRSRPKVSLISYFKDIKVDEEKRKAYINEQEIHLTKTEFDLLVYLVKRNGKVATKDELLSKIWGFEVVLETRTLDIHVSNLRKKIASSEAKIETIRGVGFALR